MTYLRNIKRWVRSKSQRLYEWQFSPLYWTLRGHWSRLKLLIGKSFFGLRNWNSSQSQSFFILVEILKTIFWQVILAVVIIGFLAAINYSLAASIAVDLPKISSGTATEFLGIVAQVAGIFLGLYFTAVSVVASTVYARVPGEIRELLTKEKVGNLYIRVVALTVAIATLLLAKGALGFSISILDVLFTALLIIMAIFSFVLLGMRIFYFFDFTELAKQLDFELIRWLKSATTNGFRFLDPSFQSYYQKQAEKALITYCGVVTLAVKDEHFEGKSLSELISRPIMLLELYAKNKTMIPSESQWFRRTYRHRNWLTANYDEVSMALRSGTSLQPELVPDVLWFERYIEKMVSEVFQALIQRRDLGDAATVLDNLQRTQSVLGEYLAVDEAFHFSKALRNQMKEVMSVEDSIQDDEDIQLARLGLIDANCLGLISILLGLSKTLRETKHDSFSRRIDNINWHKPKSIYVSLIPREVITQLEYLQSRLAFEYEAEGKFISPSWYYKQIAAQSMVHFIEVTTNKLVKELEEMFSADTERLILEKKYLNATQVIQRGLEVCDKFFHHLKTIQSSFEQFSEFRRVPDTQWADFPYEELTKRVLAVRERLISNLAIASIQLAKIPSKQNWPDYFGQCYSVLAEECNSAMAQGNETLFTRLFPAFFNATLAAHDRLSSDLAGRTDQAALVYITEPIEDLLHVSGYALVYSELDGKKYWDTVKDLWDRYLSGQQKTKEFLESINNTVNYRKSVFAILPRAPLRIGWQQKLEKRLKDEKILIDLDEYPFMGRRHIKPKHSSKIVQVIARGTMGTIFADGQDVFLAMYIAKRPEAASLKLNHSTESFLSSVTRLDDDIVEEEDSE